MNHDFFMQRAIDLAAMGRGKTSPNPCVGALVVNDVKIIGEGFHQKAGGEHAEVIAIREAKNSKGATLFVTLEPCCHFGKTPPCSDLILKSGIKKVVIGMLDPFAKVSGKGLDFLRSAGVECEIYSGELEREIRNLNQPFIKFQLEGLPYVVLKAGMSLDGKISTRSGQSKWITDEFSRVDAKTERSFCDAVMVGYGTVFDDDPELAGPKMRIILDRKLKLDLNKRVFRDENVFVACTDLASRADRDRFSKAGVSWRAFGEKNVSIFSLMKFLAKKGVQSVFVEGGAGVHGAIYDAFIKNPLVLDRVIFYIAPRILGGKEALSVVGGRGIKELASAPEFLDFSFEKLQRDLKISGRFNFY